MQVTRVISAIIIILSILANTLNIILLCRTNLKKRHIFTVYLLVLSINNIFYTCIGINYNMISDSIGINLMKYSNFSYKFISFLLDCCPHVSLNMLIIVSIDRYCCSSLNVRQQNLIIIRT